MKYVSCKWMFIVSLEAKNEAITITSAFNKSRLYGRCLKLNMVELIAANVRVFAKAGNSLNVQLGANA